MAIREADPRPGSIERAPGRPSRPPRRPAPTTPGGRDQLAVDLLALQRAAGNAAVQQLLAARTGAPTTIGAPTAAVVAAVQRAAAGMPEKLSDDINRVLDDTAGAGRTDAKMLAQILKHIREDPANERPNARHDPGSSAACRSTCPAPAP